MTHAASLVAVVHESVATASGCAIALASATETAVAISRFFGFTNVSVAEGVHHGNALHHQRRCGYASCVTKAVLSSPPVGSAFAFGRLMSWCGEATR